jgi:hypothetical protein
LQVDRLDSLVANWFGFFDQSERRIVKGFQLRTLGFVASEFDHVAGGEKLLERFLLQIRQRRTATQVTEKFIRGSLGSAQTKPFLKIEPHGI